MTYMATPAGEGWKRQCTGGLVPCGAERQGGALDAAASGSTAPGSTSAGPPGGHARQSAVVIQRTLADPLARVALSCAAGDMHVCTGFISDDLCMPDTATGTSGAAALEAFPNQQCIVLGAPVGSLLREMWAEVAQCVARPRRCSDGLTPPRERWHQPPAVHRSGWVGDTRNQDDGKAGPRCASFSAARSAAATRSCTLALRTTAAAAWAVAFQ